jgi:riboflavin kinase/FMN adenylyltransferase
LPSLVICFEPQPREFFDPANAPARLTRFREKMLLIKEQGIDQVLCFRFNESTRKLSAEQFVDSLVRRLGVKYLLVGDDFRFGHDQSGDYEMLKKAGERYGFEVTDHYTYSHEDSRVSSTRCRECLVSGDFVMAENLLGRPYSIEGKVIYGRQLGRTLGAPTANIQLHRYRAPVDGSFAVQMRGLDAVYQGVANVGVRPTVDDNARPILEVYLFDFDQDIYGRNVKVVFHHKIRDEKKFQDLDELKLAIQSDMAAARDYFRAHPPTVQIAV